MSPTTYKAVSGLAAAILRLQARCDGLEVAVRVLARKRGMDDDKICEVLRISTESAHQQLLERAESLDPEIAVDLDRREGFPDLPDRFL